MREDRLTKRLYVSEVERKRRKRGLNWRWKDGENKVFKYLRPEHAGECKACKGQCELEHGMYRGRCAVKGLNKGI